MYIAHYCYSNRPCVTITAGAGTADAKTVLAADLDGDQLPEVITGSFTQNLLLTFRNLGNMTFGPLVGRRCSMGGAQPDRTCGALLRQ